MAVTVLLNVLVYIGIDPILHFLRVPDEVWDGMKAYLLVIFAGIIATSLYNYFSCLLRALGNSTIPLVFLAVSAVLNIGLDLLFVAVLPWGSPWCRTGNGDRTVCFRHRHYALCTAEMP